MKVKTPKQLVEGYIKKEVAKQLKEQGSVGNDFHFTTEVKNAPGHKNISVDYPEFLYEDLKGMESYLLDLADADLTVEWNIDFDLRNWGLKGFNINITKISGFFTFEYDDDDNKKEFQKEFTLPQGWKIENELTFNGSMFPSDIEIDCKSKTVTIG